MQNQSKYAQENLNELEGSDRRHWKNVELNELKAMNCNQAGEHCFDQNESRREQEQPDEQWICCCRLFAANKKKWKSTSSLLKVK